MMRCALGPSGAVACGTQRGGRRTLALTILVAFVPGMLPSRSLRPTIVRETMSGNCPLQVWHGIGYLHPAAGAACEETVRPVPEVVLD